MAAQGPENGMTGAQKAASETGWTSKNEWRKQEPFTGSEPKRVKTEAPALGATVVKVADNEESESFPILLLLIFPVEKGPPGSETQVN